MTTSVKGNPRKGADKLPKGHELGRGIPRCANEKGSEHGKVGEKKKKEATLGGGGPVPRKYSPTVKKGGGG